MTWTTRTPTQPGWYWVRWPQSHQFGPEILEITQPNGPDTDLHVGHWDEPVDEYLAEHGPCEWQGGTECYTRLYRAWIPNSISKDDIAAQMDYLEKHPNAYVK